MGLVPTAIFLLGVGLETAILARALLKRFIREFPIFYSYIFFILVCELIADYVYIIHPPIFPKVFWFYFLARTLAEFGVLWEASDAIFRLYPAVQKLGRLIVMITCVGFVLAYWIPLRWHPEPTMIMFLDLIKISALTKILAIAGLMGSARYYRIPLGRFAGGILMGFAAYEGVSLANFAAAAYFDRAVYAGILSWLGPLSFGVCLIIWTFALWNPDPVTYRQAGKLGGGYAPEFQLRRFSTYVTRFLSK